MTIILWVFLVVCVVLFARAVKEKHDKGIALWGTLGAISFVAAAALSMTPLATEEAAQTSATPSADVTSTPADEVRDPYASCITNGTSEAKCKKLAATRHYGLTSYDRSLVAWSTPGPYSGAPKARATAKPTAKPTPKPPKPTRVASDLTRAEVADLLQRADDLLADADNFPNNMPTTTMEAASLVGGDRGPIGSWYARDRKILETAAALQTPRRVAAPS
jgi:hypothetical protein